jgi:hypothetical protein
LNDDSHQARAKIHKELPWISAELLGEAHEIPEWTSVFRIAKAFEVKTSAHGHGVFCVVSRVSPREMHVFYDPRSISPSGREVPSSVDAEARLNEKVKEFNQIIGSDLQIGPMNKYIYASILSHCLFPGHRGRLEGIGVLTEEMTEPKISFDVNGGGYVFRLFHSRDEKRVWYWLVETKDGGYIKQWSVHSESL